MMEKHAEKPFAPSCERNQQVILEVLKKHLRPDDKTILEVGSGTGQHAVFIAKHMPQIMWQPSDVLDNHPGIELWLQDADLDNVQQPLAFEVGKDSWPDVEANVVFTANTLHIMSLELVDVFLQDVGQHLKVGGRLMIYGPFKYRGEFTTQSNADFDLWLKDIGPERGIRDFEHISAVLQGYNVNNVADISMPANNQFLVFEKHD